jgi:uncharacterized membrane protein
MFFKLGSDKLSLSTLLSNYWLMAGLAFYGLATVGYTVMLRFGRLSALYSLIGLSYIWVGLLSWYFLKERVVLLNWLGFGLILFGVFLAQAK